MSKYQDCAEQILSIMIYSDSDEYIRNETKLSQIFETMLIFLDYDDLIDIVKNRVIPKYNERNYKNKDKWILFLNNSIKYWYEYI